MDRKKKYKTRICPHCGRAEKAMFLSRGYEKRNGVTYAVARYKRMCCNTVYERIIR